MAKMTKNEDFLKKSEEKILKWDFFDIFLTKFLHFFEKKFE